MVSSKVFVIFDVDGTINQTEVYAVKAYRKALEETGKTGFSDQELIERIGAPFEQDVRYFFGENESEQVELFRKLIQKYWINGIKDSAKTFEGIHQMLEELKDVKIKKHTVTSIEYDCKSEEKEDEVFDQVHNIVTNHLDDFAKITFDVEADHKVKVEISEN